MSDQTDISTGPEPIDPDRLNGWKEIASFLGKGVRTAQRWEKDYCLPVHRLGREGGEIIFASRREISDWLESGGGRDAREHPHADNNQQEPEPAAEAQNGSTGAGRRTALRVLATAAAVVLGAGAWLVTRPAPSPDHWHLEGRRLLVYDSEDTLVFEHEFAFAPVLHDFPFERQSGGTGLVQDIDADGTREVIFGARSTSHHDLMAFYIFNADGSIRAEVRPEHVVAFGDVTYAGPWLPYRVFVNERPYGPPAIHLVFIHGQNYPSLLQEIDADGNPVAEYWSNGYVQQVEYVQWRDLEVLAVGASNNDFQGSSLALFESGVASGSAPAEKDAYRCLTCPPGSVYEPSAFLVFPRRCLHESINGTGAIGDVWVDAAGSIFVRVEEGTQHPTGPNLNSAVTYVLDSNLNLLRVEPLAGFFAEHDAWHKSGRIDHPLSPERDGPLFFPVRVWRENGFVDLPPGPIDWSQYDSRSDR